MFNLNGHTNRLRIDRSYSADLYQTCIFQCLIYQRAIYQNTIGVVMNHLAGIGVRGGVSLG